MLLPRVQMPSLQELTAFEAAGRHASFTRAAEELALSQSAISKQIRELEQTLGARLFERNRGRVVLTAAGRSFLADVRRILEGYATAAHSIMASSGSERTLRVGVLPTFASRWLIPRLADFLADRPGLSVSVFTEPEPFDLAATSADAAIHFGAADWAHAVSTYLCDQDVVAVAAPGYLERCPLEAMDLLRATLLQQATRPMLWRNGSKRRGSSILRRCEGLFSISSQ